MRPSASRMLAAATVAGALLVPACSDDDDGATDTENTEAPADTGADTDPDTADTTGDATGGGDEAFCQAVVDTQTAINALEGPEGDPAAVEGALDAVEGSTPEDLADAAGTLVSEGRAALEGGPESEGPSEAFYQAYGEVASWMSDNCGFQVLDVVGEDYAFEGIPETADAGPTVVNFENAGEEPHEIVMFRIADDTEATIDELLAMPEEEAESLIAFAGAAMAAPGESSATVADLEPGRYGALCFIPVGSTVEDMENMGPDAEASGPPHFTEGMVVEFTVG